MALLRWQRNIVDAKGDVLEGAEVEIREESTGALVNLFADINGNTVKGNPIVTDSSGYAFAYMEPGRFKVTATSADQKFSFSWRDVRLVNDFAEIARRTIYVGSVAELESLSLPVGTNVYLTEEGRAGEFVVKAGTPPSDPQKGIYIPLANGNYVERIDKSILTPEMFGATFDGSDDAPAWNGLADLMPAGAVITSTTPGGTSTCNADVLFTKDVIFNMPDVRVVMTGGDFNITGAIETLTATLSADASKGENSFTVSDGTQFAENDVIIIQNADDFSFSPHRPTYQDGEFLTVRNVAANTVELTSGLLSSYLAAGNIQFHKVTPVYVSMKGIKFSGLATDNLVELDLVKDFVIESVDVKGGTNRALGLRRCYGGKLFGGAFEHKEPAAGTNYGISVANCQDLELFPTHSYGTRHGVATGGYGGAGAVPCRNVIIRNAVVSSADSHAADIHGNAENCYYIDCNIHGGTGIGGKNCGVIGGTVLQRAGVLQSPLQWTEIVGGTMTFQGIQTAMPAGGGGNMCSPNSSTTLRYVSENLTVRILDIVCDVPASNTSSGPISWSITYPGTVRSRMEINNIEFTGDVSGLTRIFTGALNNDAAHATPPVPFETFILDNIKMDISTLDFWYIFGGTVATGSKVTAPALESAGNVTIPAGGYVSPSHNFNFPEYGVIPSIEALMDQYQAPAGEPYVVPVCDFAQPGRADVVITTVVPTATVAVNVTARATARVSLNNFVWP